MLTMIGIRRERVYASMDDDAQRIIGRARKRLLGSLFVCIVLATVVWSLHFALVYLFGMTLITSVVLAIFGIVICITFIYAGRLSRVWRSDDYASSTETAE